MSKIETRLRRAVNGGKFATELRVGAGYVTNGHWMIHRGELISQGLGFDEGPEHDVSVLRALKFTVCDDELTEKQASAVLPELDSNNVVTYEPTRWLWESSERGVGTWRLVRESNGLRWSLVQDQYLALMADTETLVFLRPTNGDQENTPLLVSNRRFCVMPVKKGGEYELQGLDFGWETVHDDVCRECEQSPHPCVEHAK